MKNRAFKVRTVFTHQNVNIFFTDNLEKDTGLKKEKHNLSIYSPRQILKERDSLKKGEQLLYIREKTHFQQKLLLKIRL